MAPIIPNNQQAVSITEVGQPTNTSPSAPSVALCPALPSTSQDVPGTDTSRKVEQLKSKVKEGEASASSKVFSGVMAFLDVLDFVCGLGIAATSIITGTLAFGPIAPLFWSFTFTGVTQGTRVMIDAMKNLINRMKGDEKQSESLKLTEDQPPSKPLQLDEDAIQPHKKKREKLSDMSVPEPAPESGPASAPDPNALD